MAAAPKYKRAHDIGARRSDEKRVRKLIESTHVSLGREIATTTVCTGVGVPPGTWTYTDSPVKGSWTETRAQRA
jgi:hypothetical protein